MPYNEKLASKIRDALSQQKKVEEKKMMGGLTFMVNGKMCVGILNDDLMVRFDPELHETILKKKSCREMDFTGRPMKGFVFTGPEETGRATQLLYWIELALEYNSKAKASKKRKKSQKQKKM